MDAVASGPAAWARLALAAALGWLGSGCGDTRAAGGADGVASRTASAPEPKPATGFRIDSDPAGAVLLVDGVLRGATPIALEDLSPGRYVVRLEHAGYLTWETPLQLARGQVVHLPAAKLIRAAPAAPKPAPAPPPSPVPRWPKHAGLPPDLQVVIAEGNLGWHHGTELRVRGAGSGVVTLRYGRRDRKTCSFQIDQRALARFGWRQFVEAIETGNLRRSDCTCDAEDCCSSLSVSIRAFGRTLAPQEVGGHGLAHEIEARVSAVTRGLVLPPRGPIDEALAAFDAVVETCLAAADREAEHFASPFELAIPRRSGRARLVAIDPHHSRSELACIRKAIAATTFPGSPTCDLRLRHSSQPPSSRFLNPYR